MAGSSLPGTWRRPAVEVRRSSPLREIVALSYHTLYGYGFHALEMVQCLAERRRGGETGVRSVQCLEGPAVWEAMRAGRWSRVLQDAAASRLTRPMPADLEKTVPTPTAFLIDYRDGLRATVLTLNGAVGEWSVAWQEQGKAAPESTLFWTQEARPFGHFSFLLRGIEEMIHRGRPSWPVERTLLTTGVLDALLESRFRGGRPLETPWLRLDYPATPGWTDPGPPPPSRPVNSY
jgi:hypothetical protein